MKRVAGILGLTLALVCVSLAAVAVAHTARFDSTITIHLKKHGNDPDVFSGTVSSTKPRCVTNRTVRLSQKPTSGPSVLVGTDTTDANGDWEVTLTGDAPVGTYHAAATRKVLLRNAHHSHVCRRAVSRDVTVH